MPVKGFGGSILEDEPTYLILLIAGFFAVACWGSLEVYILTFWLFKSRHSLYYWSICAANTGVVAYATGTMLRFFGVVPPVPASILSNLGWWLMTTGHWLVLFSRLHLVVGETRKLRWILVAVAFVFFAVQVPTATIFIVANAGAPGAAALRRVFHVLEIAQLAIIALLEGTISGLYVYESSRVLSQLRSVRGAARVRTMFRQLLALFVLVVTLDLSLMLTYYTDHFLVETTMKPAIYNVKLKVELFVLNELVSLVQTGPCSCQVWQRNEFLVAEGGHRVPLGANAMRRSSASGQGFLWRAVELAGPVQPVRASTHIFDERVQHVKTRDSVGHSCTSSRT